MNRRTLTMDRRTSTMDRTIDNGQDDQQWTGGRWQWAGQLTMDRTIDKTWGQPTMDKTTDNGQENNGQWKRRQRTGRWQTGRQRTMDGRTTDRRTKDRRTCIGAKRTSQNRQVEDGWQIGIIDQHAKVWGRKFSKSGKLGYQALFFPHVKDQLFDLVP